MADEYQYFKNKRNDRVYLSRSLESKIPYKTKDAEIKEIVRPFRIISKVIDCKESHKFIKDGEQVSLRITDGERQEITAKFYEDTRGIFTLNIQKYTLESGVPHNIYFTFTGDEIATLYNFIRNVAVVPTKSKGKVKLDDSFINELVLSKDQLITLIAEQPDLINEIVKNNTTSQEIALLGERKNQLEMFGQLLNDKKYFDETKKSLGSNKRPEDVWENFFEKNTWIFGFGLSYQFNSPLEGKKLEQSVKGYDFNASGKRVDGLLKTRGFLSSLAFGEIKTHTTPLIQNTSRSYRGESWRVSDELSGGVAQIQRTVQVSVKNISTKTQIKAKDGSLTGEDVFLYTPKSFLIIGSLSEFGGEHGINEDKYSSFEMFRRNLGTPEIITFDELYERAKHIVEISTAK